MAAIRRYVTPRGAVRYRVEWRLKSGGSRSKSFTKKSIAEQFRRKIESELLDGSYIDPRRGDTLVSEIATTYLSHKQRSWAPSSTRSNTLYIENHILPVWGDVAVADVSASQVQQWVNGLAEDLAPKTTRLIYAQLNAILETAVRDRLIRENPCAGVDLPKAGAKRRVYLTMSQVRRLAEECGQFGDVVLMLATTGLRWGELAALTPRDIDFSRRRIRVWQNAVTVGAEVVLGPTKTSNTRSITFPPLLDDALKKRIAEAASADSPLFHYPDSPRAHLKLPTSGQWFWLAVRRLHSCDQDFPIITLHDLRHVAAGLLVNAGASVLVVQQQLGHAKPSMTLDTYSDLFDSALDDLAPRFEAMWRETEQH